MDYVSNYDDILCSFVELDNTPTMLELMYITHQIFNRHHPEWKGQIVDGHHNGNCNLSGDSHSGTLICKFDLL